MNDLLEKVKGYRWWAILKALAFEGGPSSTKWVYLAMNAVLAAIPSAITAVICWVYVRSVDHHVDGGLLAALVTIVGIISTCAVTALNYRRKVNAQVKTGDTPIEETPNPITGGDAESSVRAATVAMLLCGLLMLSGTMQGQINVTANSCIATADLQMVPTGTFEVQITDGNDNPVFVSASGIQITSEPVRRNISAGSVPMFQLPTPASAVPTNFFARVTVFNKATNKTTVYRRVPVNPVSGTWNWCTASITASFSGLPTVPVPGRDGAQGPPGCTVGGSCSAALTPQSIAGRVYPTAFANTGDDLNAMVQRALASLGGTSASPIERAVVELPVGMAFATSTVVLPNNKTAPYVSNVDFICHSNFLSSTSASQPIFHVLAYNNNGGMNAGSVSGCILNDPASSPAVQVDARQAFEVYNNLFISGTVGLRETNTVFNDGYPGYHEQHWIHNNDFRENTVAGIEFLKDGGTDSIEYGAVDWTNHFQLVCGAAAIHLGTGITVQGGVLSGRINTSSSTCATSTTAAVAIRNDGSGVYRGTVGHWSGEDTGNLIGQAGGPHFALFDGPGATTLIDYGTIVTSMALRAAGSNPFSHVSLPYNQYSTSVGTDSCANVDGESAGAGSVLARKPIFANCQSSVRMYSGAEGWGDMGHIYYGGDSPQAMTSTRSVWRSFAAGLTFGPGYSPRKSDGTCLDTAGCNTAVDVAEGQSLTIKVPGNSMNHGLRTHAETDGVHLTMQNQSGAAGQPTEWLIFDGYDSSGGTYGLRTFLKGRFEGGTYVWYFPTLTGSGCANLVVRADGSVARGASVTCP